jgi:hypothetical protein
VATTVRVATTRITPHPRVAPAPAVRQTAEVHRPIAVVRRPIAAVRRLIAVVRPLRLAPALAPIASCAT